MRKLFEYYLYRVSKFSRLKMRKTALKIRNAFFISEGHYWAINGDFPSIFTVINEGKKQIDGKKSL